jgi:ribosome biogenesis GTPase / thiamine phosphate phosphatase
MDITADPVLVALGWTPALAEAFAASAGAGLQPARVLAADGPSWVVAGPGGEVRAVAAGRLRRDSGGPEGRPVVGDWVTVRPGENGGQTVIKALLPRRSWFARGRGDGGSGEQVVAANLDLVLLVVGLDGDQNVRRLERYLAMTWEGGAQPVLVLNKADQHPDPEGQAATLAALAPGVEVVLTSAVTGQGVEELAAMLGPGRTAALLGSSGVGKSSLTNRLLGAERQSIGALRTDGKGRHTTTRRELLRLPGGGLLIDTPGLRTVVMGDAGEGLADAFSDVDELAAECRFADCRHDTEPGCAVLAAVEAGTLPAERLDAWRKLQAEQTWQATRDDKAAAAARERGWRSVHKAMRHPKNP